MKELSIGLILMMLFSSDGLADKLHPASKLIKNKLDAVFSMFNNKEISESKKQDEIVQLVEPVFDFTLMAKLTLGRDSWNAFSHTDKEKFTDLFRTVLKKSFFDNLARYSDKQFQFESTILKGKKVQVPTYVNSKGKKIIVIYKLYNSVDEWKIYDLEIQGVSIIRSYRSQFNDILQKATTRDLMKALEELSNR